MPVCAVCESEDFDERDGLYYCQTCLTQSQDYRREEEAEDGGTYNIQTELRKKTGKEKISKDDHKGRPWHTFEAFTVIIREQVRALISLGASPKLKDVVLQLWCNYLSKTGVAFPEDEEKFKSFTQGFMRQREKYPGSLKCPEIQPIRRMNTTKRNLGVSRKQSDQNIEEEILASNLQNEEFYEGDDPTQRPDDEQMSDYSSDEDKIDNNMKRIGREHAEWMSMSKSLCFCYIGTLYTDKLILVSDIIRWANQNRIPYFEATLLLPEDMRFSTDDPKTFAAIVLTHEYMVMCTQRLINFLGLSDIPEVPLTTMASKSIVMLDLPGEVHGLVSNLIQSDDKTEEDRKFKELTAMGYVITILQLLFGLDDSSEIEISNISVELNAVLNSRYNLFVWSEWTTHINQKIKTGFQHLFDDPRDIKDTHTFIKHFQLLDKKKYCESRNKKDRTFRQETQDALLRPLELLQKKLQSTSSRRDVEFDEDEYNPDLEPTLSDSFLHSEDTEKRDTESNVTSLKFRTSSVRYISQPDTFQKELDDANLTRVSLHNVMTESSEEESNMSEMDLFETPRKKKRQKSVLRTSLSEGEVDDAHNKKLLELIEKLSRVQGYSFNAKFDKKKKFNNLIDRSKSYQWLIRTCATILSCSVESLNTEVGELHNCLFSDWDRSQIYRKKKLVSLYKR